MINLIHNQAGGTCQLRCRREAFYVLYPCGNSWLPRLFRNLTRDFERRVGFIPRVLTGPFCVSYTFPRLMNMSGLLP